MVTNSDARWRGLALVGAGGFLGAILRWGIDGWLGSGLPLGTLGANLLAAVLLGVLLSEAHLPRWPGADARLLVGTGFCGSLSTYSTFALETATLPPAIAGGYVVSTYLLGFAAVVAGDRLARWIA